MNKKGWPQSGPPPPGPRHQKQVKLRFRQYLKKRCHQESLLKSPKMFLRLKTPRWKYNLKERLAKVSLAPAFPCRRWPQVFPRPLSEIRPVENSTRKTLEPTQRTPFGGRRRVWEQILLRDTHNLWEATTNLLPTPKTGKRV